MGFITMTRSTALSFLFFISCVSAVALFPRQSTAPVATCVGLSVKSNDGGRKVALVIDSSGSMLTSDPFDLRLAAARALNDWLITKSEATGGRKSDLVTVIDFDYTATLDYPLGDPTGANATFDTIGGGGGTYIAGGVIMGIAQLTGSSSGSTSGRSSMIVFTDGEDSDTETLVDEINRASSLGIRVSFGFLDAGSGVQDKTVLDAIKNSGGVYATITTEDASNNFINFAILNGLTRNDNPAGNNSTLLAGLSIAHFVSGTQTETITYNAQANEHINFTIDSIDAGILNAQAVFGGNVLNVTNTTSFGASNISVTAPGAGQIQVKVTADEAPAGSMFIIGADSNMPIQNCTVAVTDTPKGSGGGGLNTGAKVGLGVGIPALIACIGIGCFFLFKYFGHLLPPYKKPPTPTMNHNPPPEYVAEKPVLTPTVSPVSGPGYPPVSVPPATYPGSSDLLNSDVPQNTAHPPPPKNKHQRLRRKGLDEELHHHHLPMGHPCSGVRCPMGSPQHICKDPNEDPKGPCTCTDQDCPLNDPDHQCVEDLPPCTCEDEECPINKQQQNAALGNLAGNAIGGVARILHT